MLIHMKTSRHTRFSRRMCEKKRKKNTSTQAHTYVLYALWQQNEQMERAGKETERQHNSQKLQLIYELCVCVRTAPFTSHSVFS